MWWKLGFGVISRQPAPTFNLVSMTLPAASVYAEHCVVLRTAIKRSTWQDQLVRSEGCNFGS